MKKTLGYFLLAVVLIPLSCTRKVGLVNFGDYPHDIGKIINTNCSVSGCHNAVSAPAAASLNLETWSAMFKGSSNGSPVIPYSSKFSSLCYFINTYSNLGAQNVPTMPLNESALSYEEVKKIKDWIDAGAPDKNGKVMWAEANRKKLYAVNQGCDVVTVLDAETQLPMRYINVGNRADIESPHQVRVSPDGNYWYVIFTNNNIMQKFRCSDDSYVGDIPLSPYAAGQSSNPQDDAFDWNSFIITKDGRKGYCASLNKNGKVAAVDLVNRKLLHYQAGFVYSHGVALNAAEDKVYVTAQQGNFITRIDTGFVFSTFEIPIENGVNVNYASSLDAHDIILSPDGQNFWITCQKSNEVRVFNINSGLVTAAINTGTFPQEIVYSKSRNEYFVSCTSDTTGGAYGSVTRISGSNYLAAKLYCGFQPHGIAVHDNTGLLYVLSRNLLSKGPLPHHTNQCGGRNGYVSFVDLNTFRVLPKKYELSSDPYFIFAQP